VPELNRRGFLAGLFGAAVVAAAGPIPAALEALPENKFKEVVGKAASKIKILSGAPEIWGDGKGTYSFSPIEGFVPLRETSERIAEGVLNDLYKEFRSAPPI